MSANPTHPDVKRLEIPGADFRFHFFDIEGVVIPLFTGLLIDGPANRLEAIRDMDTRPDDIILTAYLKSGTHWSWEILNMLVNGKAEYKKVTKRALEPELLTNMKYLDKEKSPRVINTHLPFRWLPQQHVQNGGKFIHVMRNPKDLFVSLYHYFKTAVAPFIGSNLEELTWNDFFHIFITGNSAMRRLLGGWFSYEKEMDKARTDLKGYSVYTLHYENLILNPTREIRNLAMYLGVPCTDGFAKEIAEKCSFQNMRTVQKEYPKEMEEQLKGFQAQLPKLSLLFRKGIIGDWKNTFTEAQNEEFEALYKEEMEGFQGEVVYEPR